MERDDSSLLPNMKYLKNYDTVYIFTLKGEDMKGEEMRFDFFFCSIDGNEKFVAVIENYMSPDLFLYPDVFIAVKEAKKHLGSDFKLFLGDEEINQI